MLIVPLTPAVICDAISNAICRPVIGGRSGKYVRM
jgi:hypothetical protein